MSLTKFNLPGKDCRCILYDGKVCKIKTLLPPIKDGNISEYIDDKTLQEEVEDIIRAVLCIPHNVDPVMMKTKHFFAKPEKKEWKLPNKVEFKQPGQSLSALPFMFVLNLQLYAAKQGTQGTNTIQEAGINEEEDIESKKRKSSSSSSSYEKTTQSKRPKRRLVEEGPSSLPRSNRRMAPPRSSSSGSSKPGYALRKRALRLTTTRERGGSHTVPSDDVDLDEAGMIDGWDGRRNRDRIEGGRQEREDSPELESGFSRLVQGKVPVGPERFPRVNERGDKVESHIECTGDQGPMPAWPSDGGEARVGVPRHPGRERVEQHVLQEQLRLQEIASPGGNGTGGDGTAEDHCNDRGVIHRVYDAMVTPVKKFFTRD